MCDEDRGQMARDPVDSAAMDAVDREILEAVVADGRITLLALAERIRLSPSATRERLRRLEATIIDGYTAHLDPVASGFALDAIVEVDLPPGAEMAPFEAAIGAMPQVIEALHGTGAHDYLLRLRCTDPGELHTTVRRLKTELGAARTETSVVLDTPVRRRQRLPV